jgi:hypothetical protein
MMLLAFYFILICNTLRNYVTSLILCCDMVITMNVEIIQYCTVLTTNRPQTEKLEAKRTYVFT